MPRIAGSKRLAALVAAGALAYASTLIPSPSGLQRITAYEGTRNVAYLDSVGVPTICTGSTRAVRIGQVAKPGECAERLREDSTYAGKALGRLVLVPVTQGQYDALVSLTFNIGGTAFGQSTLLRRLNSGDCYGTAREFDRWVYAGGKRLAGLVKRRQDERKHFERDCPVWAS